MTDDPPAVARLNGLLAAARIAHEAIYDLHAELVASGRTGERIGLTTEARRLARRWQEESVLDPDRSAATLRELGMELERIAPGVGNGVARQREIARELQSLRGGPA